MSFKAYRQGEETLLTFKDKHQITRYRIFTSSTGGVDGDRAVAGTSRSVGKLERGGELCFGEKRLRVQIRTRPNARAVRIIELRWLSRLKKRLSRGSNRINNEFGLCYSGTIRWYDFRHIIRLPRKT